MEAIANVFADVIINSRSAVIEHETDYRDSEGILYCGKCRSAKQMMITIFGEIMKVGCMCDCEAEKAHAEKEQERLAIEKIIIERARDYSISDPAYRRFTFETDKGKCPKAIGAARWYADNFPRMKVENKGMMFMGTVGTGKTFAACCIANELLSRHYTVWVTTMLPLLREAGDFNKREAVFRRIESVDLLVLDDFGTSKNSAYNSELIFEIIDARARAELPLIITTNLSVNDLKAPPDLSSARIYDRLIAMCSCERSPVVLTGKSVRNEIARAKHIAPNNEGN